MQPPVHGSQQQADEACVSIMCAYEFVLVSDTLSADTASDVHSLKGFHLTASLILLLQVVHEPVEQWQSVRTVEGDTLNLLDKFYSNPPKYAYTFQNYVFMSRVLQVGRQQTVVTVPPVHPSYSAYC